MGEAQSKKRQGVMMGFISCETLAQLEHMAGGKSGPNGHKVGRSRDPNRPRKRVRKLSIELDKETQGRRVRV